MFLKLHEHLSLSGSGNWFALAPGWDSCSLWCLRATSMYMVIPHVTAQFSPYIHESEAQQWQIKTKYLVLTRRISAAASKPCYALSQISPCKGNHFESMITELE
uniref:Uncharacterized protein n=1 Tax=Eutreptiella gymnastica TaxID=73025 RepID=A0A7S4CXN1_9EUGL